MVRGRGGPWNPLIGQEGLAGQAGKMGVEAQPFKMKNGRSAWSAQVGTGA
jgi:hypothetical protein